MHYADYALLLIAAPLSGIMIYVLGLFVPHRYLELLLLLVACACLGIMSFPLGDAKTGQETLAAIRAPRHHARVARVEAPSNQFHGFDQWTAIYDISAHAVYLPNGLILEAHSGLGTRLDDPRFVHERMRGATPPNVYELTEREKPFHGVRALRLSPVEPGKVFGRAGLLAHTYMLGPRGDSNGCVVFKNYTAFLQAFDGGDIKRLAVVAHLEPNDLKSGAIQMSDRQKLHRANAQLAVSSLMR